MKKFAVIDLGTNTFNTKIIHAFSKVEFEEIESGQSPVKLGEGGLADGKISSKAFKRGIKVLEEFKKLIASHGVTDIFAFGTSAIRTATNGKEFIQKGSDILGFPIKTIDGKEEAELIYQGIKLSGVLNHENALMMDIGGGSIEFIIGNDKEALESFSFEVGAARLIAKFELKSGIISPEKAVEIKDYLAEVFAPVIEASRIHKPINIIGAAGSFETLASIDCKTLEMEEQDAENDISANPAVSKQTQLYEIPVSRLNQMSEKIIFAKKDELKGIPGMALFRIEMMPVATLTVHLIAQLTGVKTIYCSEYAIKEGMIGRVLKSGLFN